MTQDELAQFLGINRATLSKYESGIIDPPTSQLQRIADALGVHVAKLMGYEFLGKTDEGFDFYGPSPQMARANAAMEQMTEDGRSKVADYAEDILPRYRAEARLEAGESTPAPKDTTPAEPGPETAENGG